MEFDAENNLVTITLDREMASVNNMLQSVSARKRDTNFEELLHSKVDKELFIKRLAEFLKLSTANGRPSQDTMNSYISHIKQFGKWCNDNSLNPFELHQKHIILYRGYLIEKTQLKPQSISLKLTAIRRFYQAAVNNGLMEVNPAKEVFLKNKDEESFGTRHITAGNLEYLFRLIPRDGSEESLRAKAMIALMAIEGLRTVEIHRASVSDIDWDNSAILVHGKGRDARIYPRDDVMIALKSYLAMRTVRLGVEKETPIFTSISNNQYGTRISRDGVRDVADKWLRAADLKEAKLSCHLFRHTCGALLYQNTKDLRVVQETLRHSDPRITAKYAHVQDRSVNRYTNSIPVKL